MFLHLREDFLASIVVFLVAVPLCLGIALASGAPLFAGLIAGMVGGVVVGLICDSQLGVSGPAAGLAVIVASAIVSLGSFEVFLLAVVLAGVMQVILGVAKAGVVGYYFPNTVIKGMLAGIGIIILLKQIPHAFGYDADYEGDLDFNQLDGENTFTELLRMLDNITPGAALLSSICLLVLIIWPYLTKNRKLGLLPAPLLVIFIGIAYQLLVPQNSSLAISAEHLVNVPVAENFGEFIRLFTTPDFSQITNIVVWKIAATIALVASLETLLSVEAIDKLDPHKRFTSTNRELVAQGIGNTCSGLIGGLPVTQVIVRSSANVQSRGQTKTSAILHGLLILLSLVAIPTVLNMVPLAVLASILIVVGYKLANPRYFTQLYKAGASQFYPFIVTIVGIIFTDLLTGIALGMAVGFFIILRNNYRNSHFLHIEKSDVSGHKVKMTLSEEVSFLNKGAVQKSLTSLPIETDLTIDLSKSVRIHPDVLEVINDFAETAHERQQTVHIITKPKAAVQQRRFNQALEKYRSEPLQS